MNVLKDLGAAPVSLPFRDLYVALQTNSIQGVVTNLDSIHRAKLHEVAPHILLTDKLWAPIAYFININQKKWDKLPDDMKQAFGRAAKNAETRFSEKYAQWLTLIEEDMKKAGCTMTPAAQSDYDLWLNSPAQQENVQAWIEAASKAGVEDAEAVLKNMRSIVQEEIAKENN
jgi:TRAP-type C4-dicarboxylate transport system substrate-binding protein